MGYESHFEYEIIGETRVDVQKIQEIERQYASDDEAMGFYGVRFVLDGDLLSAIEVEENCAKFYDDRPFAEKLRESLLTGKVRLHFFGEDDSYWGYEITPEGIEDLVAVIMTRSEFKAWEQRNKGGVVWR